MNIILPDLVELKKQHRENITVDVLYEKEGFKTISNLLIKTGKDLYSIGFEEIMFEKMDAIFMQNFFRREKEKKITEYNIVSKGTKFLYKSPHLHYKFIDTKYFTPAPFFIFSDYVAFHIWEPFTIILIKSKGLSGAFRKYHSLLWKIAKNRKG